MNNIVKSILLLVMIMHLTVNYEKFTPLSLTRKKKICKSDKWLPYLNLLTLKKQLLLLEGITEKLFMLTQSQMCNQQKLHLRTKYIWIHINSSFTLVYYLCRDSSHLTLNILWSILDIHLQLRWIKSRQHSSTLTIKVSLPRLAQSHLFCLVFYINCHK